MVINGQRVNAQVTNAAYISRLADSDTIGTVSLRNPTQGSSIDSIQRAINKIYEGLGTSGENDLNINNYLSNNYVTDGDDRRTAISTLDTALKALSERVDLTEQDIADILNLINTIGGGGESQTSLGYYDDLGLADGIQTDFTLDRSTNFNFGIVFVNGLAIDTNEYTITGTTLSFGLAPAQFSIIEIFYFNSTQLDRLSGETLSGTVNGTNKIFTYTGLPKTTDGINLFINGLFIYKDKYTVNFQTKEITLNSAPQLGDTLKIFYTEGSTNVDSYQFYLGQGNGINTAYTLDFVSPFNSSSCLVFVNGVSVDRNEFTIMQNTVVFDVAPAFGQEIEIIIYDISKGESDFTFYRTLTAAENSSRTLQLLVSPQFPKKVLVDVLGATYLIHGIDFTISGDKFTLLNSTRGNAVITNSTLRLYYRG